MYAFLFSDVIFISEIEVIYLFTLLIKGKNPSKTSQDYCNPGKRKIIVKISPPGNQKTLIISMCCTFLFNNNIYTDFRTAYRHVLIPSYIFQMI